MSTYQMYKIRIPGTPKAKGSVRVGRYGHYNPSAKGMAQVRSYVQKKMAANKMPKLKGPLLVIVHYRIPAPVTLSVPKRKAQDLRPHIKRPDGDNLEKFLNDALNDVLWADDSQIAWLVRSKSITIQKQGDTTIFARELPDTAPDYDVMISDILTHLKIGE